MNQQTINGSSATLGMALMMCVAIMGALDAVLVRMLSPSVHPFVIAFTRSVFGLLFVLPWIIADPGLLKSHYHFRHLLRAGLKLASLIAFFAAYASAALADVTAIAFTAPLFVSLGAWVFLGERFGSVRMLGVAAGFVGVLIVLRPAQAGGISNGLALALLGALLTAIIQLLLKPMSARDSVRTLVAWNLLLTVPLAAVPAWFVWKMPSAWEWGLLSVQGVMGALAMGVTARAFSLADASLLAPVDFLRLPVVAVLAYLLFAQAAGVSTWIGGALIFAATMLVARSASMGSRDKLPGL